MLENEYNVVLFEGEKGYNCEEGLCMKSICPERVYEEVKKICSNGI